MPSSFPEDIPLGAIVSITTRGRYVFLNNRLHPLGLSAGQFPVLMLLSSKQNLMQEDLVRHYRLDKGTIARAVKKLEDAGYIRRTTDPANRRAVRLFLTAKGEAVIPLLVTIDQEWENHIVRGLPTAERAALHDLLKRVAKNSLEILGKNGGSMR